MSKIRVLSHRGKLIGVWLPPPEATDPNRPVSGPVAGPGGEMHELELADAEAFHDRARGAELEALVKKTFKLS
jgi:hypothetical protein